MSSSFSPSLFSSFVHDSALTRHGTKFFSFPHTTATPSPRCVKSFSAKCSLDEIPKQFRQENLKDGLMDNYKNAPQSLYGLNPSQMDMFVTEDSPIRRMSAEVSEESISSAKSYLDHSGIGSVSSMDYINGPARLSMSVSMYRGGRGTGRRRRSPPPDLPSLLLDNRIVFLGMPIVPAVTELILAEFMWLDYVDSAKPIYLYINSSGTQNEDRECVGSETDAYAIADMISHVKPDVYTVNLAMAFGQAAMLLALGKKGYRAVLPNSSTKLYLPKVHRSSGSVMDMWIKAKELDVNSEYYIEFLAKGIGKSEEEIAKDIQRTRFFRAQDAVDYGIADRIMDQGEAAYEKRNDNRMSAQRALRGQGGGNPQAAPSGFS